VYVGKLNFTFATDSVPESPLAGGTWAVEEMNRLEFDDMFTTAFSADAPSTAYVTQQRGRSRSKVNVTHLPLNVGSSGPASVPAVPTVPTESAHAEVAAPTLRRGGGAADADCPVEPLYDVATMHATDAVAVPPSSGDDEMNGLHFHDMTLSHAAATDGYRWYQPHGGAEDEAGDEAKAHQRPAPRRLAGRDQVAQPGTDKWSHAFTPVSSANTSSAEYATQHWDRRRSKVNATHLPLDVGSSNPASASAVSAGSGPCDVVAAPRARPQGAAPAPVVASGWARACRSSVRTAQITSGQTTEI